MIRHKFRITATLIVFLTVSCSGISSKLEHASSRKKILLQSAAGQYLLASQFNAARQLLNVAIALDPGDPRTYLLRGQANLGLYEWDLALADYEMAIQVEPTFAEAYYHLGILYYSILQTGLETREEALANFEQYLAMVPNGEYTELAKNYIESIETSREALLPCC